jgi:predicted outer membrane repeat protein
MVTFTGNSATNGGAISARESSAILEAVAFEHNAAYANGGGIFAVCTAGSELRLQLSHVRFSDNVAMRGGAIFLAGMSMVVEQAAFHRNRAAVAGAAIYAHGSDTVPEYSYFGVSSPPVDQRLYPWAPGAVLRSWSGIALSNSTLISDSNMPLLQSVNYSAVFDSVAELNRSTGHEHIIDIGDLQTPIKPYCGISPGLYYNSCDLCAAAQLTGSGQECCAGIEGLTTDLAPNCSSCESPGTAARDFFDVQVERQRNSTGSRRIEVIGVFTPVASGEYNFEIQSSGEAQMWFGSDAVEGEEQGSQHNTTVSVPFWAGTRGFDGNLAWSSELGDRDVGQMSATQSLQAYTSYPIKVRVTEPSGPLPTFHPVNVSDPCRNASAIPAVSERCIPHADGQSGANVSNVTCALTAEPLNTTTCLSALASLVNTSGDEAYPIQRNTTAESPQGAAYMSAAYCEDWQSFISSSNAIGDGGNGTYDIGNLITTSLMGGAVGNCSSDPGHNCSLGSLQYRSDFEQVPTNCFGRGGYYQMAQLDEMWIFFTTVTHNSSIDFMIRGNIGSDGGSAVTEYVFLDAAPFVGFVKRVCGGANPSVNHLTIVSRMCGDRCDGDEGLPAHTCDVTSAGNSSLGNCTGADPDLDDDRLSGILPGSPILYLLYSTTNGSCMKDEDHHRIFEAAALCLLQASRQIEPCTVTSGSGSCEYVPAFGGVSLEDACTASSDMPGQCVYTPAGQSNIAGSANETCTEGPSHVRRICAAACIAHGYDHVGLRSNNAACFCADDDDYRAGG